MSAVGFLIVVALLVSVFVSAASLVAGSLIEHFDGEKYYRYVR